MLDSYEDALSKQVCVFLRKKGYRRFMCGLDRDELECSNVRNGESSFAVSASTYEGIYLYIE